MLTFEDALASLEEEMLAQPSIENLSDILLKCAKERNLTSYALSLHAHIRKNGLEAHTSLGNYLVSMLVEAGSICNAQKVFDRLLSRSECSWNSLINGYIKCGESGRALALHQKMQEDSLHPSGYTFVTLLKACAQLKDVERGHQIHAHIARKGLLESNLFVGTALVDMYAKCGSLAKAKEVFDMLPSRNTVSWNALIAGYAQHEHGKEALNCFERMKIQGVPPDAVTFVCSLKACSSIGATDKGQEIHADIERKGLIQSNLVVGTALVDMYAKCGMLAKAHEVFDKLPVRHVASWTALMGGYAQHECGEEALNCFEQMQLEGVSPDAVTFACSLKACGSIGAIDKGKEIHIDIKRKGLLKGNLVVGTALVDMYAKCGLLAKAEEVFDKLPVRDVVSWNALIAGYAQHECGEEALNCFEQMELEGLSPNAVTFTCSLKACGSIGAIEKGREIHADIEQNGLLKTNQLVGNSLVDMYAKFGMLAKAQEVFDKLPIRNLVSWNALITGYAQLGELANVLCIFDRMNGEGVKPNPVTFVSVLNACSHAGLVDNGQTYFGVMSEEYGITPTLEHYTCMVDLLGCAGQLDRAVAMIMKASSHPDTVMWLTMLGACRKWGNVELGRQAFEQAVRLDEKEAAAYICMCNIYAGMEEDEKVETMREKTSMEGARMLLVD